MARTVIIYHGDCPDGFGGAFAAWKKFGDSAEYIPLKHGRPLPEGLAGAQVYFVDIISSKENLDRLLSEAESVTVLDHHEGVREIVERMPDHIYDASRSGATIAWSYFHPDTEVPLLLKYVEDGDLYKFALPDARPLLAYLYAEPFTFECWEELRMSVEDDAKRAQMIERGEIYRAHSDSIIGELVEDAKLVRFEGYEVYFAPTLSIFASDLGNRLAKKKGPLGLAVQARPDGLRISLRGDGTVDVAKIAQKYGGNGHPNASAFSIPWGTLPPWEEIKNEDSRN